MSLNKDNETCNSCGKPTQVLFSSLRYCPTCEGDQSTSVSKTVPKQLDLDILELDDITIKIDDYMF